MFPSNKRNGFSFMATIYLALVLASVTLVAASGHEQMQDIHRRVGQNRMLKKRQLLPLPGQPDDDADTPATTPTPSAAAPPGVTNTRVSTTLVPTTSDPVNTTRSPSATREVVTTPTVTTGLSTTQVTTSAVTTPSSSSTVSRSSTTSSTSETSSSTSSSTSTTLSTPTTAQQAPTTAPAPEAPETTPPPTDTQSAPRTIRTAVTKTITSDAAEATSTSTPTSTVSKTTKTTLTVIGAIAGSVGGAFLLWTIIRKWKFRPSAEFEDRMQPIDWQPTDSNDNVVAPSHHRANSGASSFHSGTGHAAQDDNLAGRGMTAYGATSDHGHGAQPVLAPIPDHDFTAGPPQPGLAPIGGYADLARGPSPQPQMQEMNRGYENYTAPAQYQGYQQEAYYNPNQRY